MAQTYLTKRRGIFYCRISIPAPYRNIIGKCEHWKSLGTSSYHEAIRKLGQETWELFRLMEGNAARVRKLRDSDIQIIAEQHYKVMMVLHEHQNATVAPILNKVAGKEVVLKLEGEELAKLSPQNDDFSQWCTDSVEANKEATKHWEQALSQGNHKAGEGLVATRLDAIHEAKIEYDRKSPAYKHLCLAVINAHIKALKHINKRLTEGWDTVPYYSGQIVPLAEQLEFSSQIVSSKSTLEEIVDKRTLGDMLKSYNNDPNNIVKGKAIKSRYSGHQKVLLEFLPAELPLHKLNRQLANDFYGKLMLMPKNFAKKFAGQNLKDYLDKHPEHKEERLKPATVAEYMIHFSEIFKWGEINEWPVKDIFKGLRPKDSVSPKEKRDAFSVEQLNTILACVIPFKNTPESRYKYWLVVVGILYGARLGELVSLKLTDLKHQHNIDYLSINRRDGKSTKTTASIRDIPLSDTLKSLGFMEYVETLKNEGEISLFPNAKYENGKPSKKFTREFTNLLTKINIKTDKLSFHSLRHSWVDFINESESPKEIVRVIGGWQEGKTMDSKVYGSGHSLKSKLEAINSIKFEGVNFV